MEAPTPLLLKAINSTPGPSHQYFLFNHNVILLQSISGQADIEQNRATTTDTTYHAYSVTKTFTALAILQLAEKGLLDIDKPVVTYLSRFSYGNTITIRHILNHTAGIPNPIPLKWIHPADSQYSEHDFIDSVISQHSKALFAPNQRFAYSNLGYIILGQVIEIVSGLSYKEYIRQHIISPLGLGDNELGFEAIDPEKHATGYIEKYSLLNLLIGFFIDRKTYLKPATGNWVPFNNFYVNGAAYGGLIGTPLAFVKYAQLLLNPDSTLITDRYKQLLFTENKTIAGKPTGMCMAWYKGKLSGHTYYAHAGGGGGYYCELRLYPGDNLGSAIFFNRTGIKDERYLDKTDRLYFEQK